MVAWLTVEKKEQARRSTHIMYTDGNEEEADDKKFKVCIGTVCFFAKSERKSYTARDHLVRGLSVTSRAATPAVLISTEH